MPTAALCLPLPRWFGVRPVATTCDAATGICASYAVDASGRRVALAPGARAVGLAVARHVRAGRLSDAVRAYADGILVGINPTDTTGAAQAILAAVAREVRYTPDPNKAEVVQHPDRLLVTRAGDCDDMAALVGALAESVGIPARVVMVRYGVPGDPDARRADVWDHVYPELDVALSGQTDWRAADATIPAVLGRPAVLGDAPVSAGGVTALILDPYAGDAGPDVMNALARPLGNPLFGGGFNFNPGGGFGLDFGSGFDFGGGFNLGGGGFGGFSLDPFGVGEGLQFGPGSEFGALFKDPISKLGGDRPSSQWIERFIAILTVATPFLLLIFGRGRANASADGVVFNPTSPEPPPGYRRVINPATGETADVPITVLEDQAYEAWEQGSSGGIGLGTVALVAAGAGAAYYFAKRR